MKIEVKRITDPDLFREVAEMTTGKPCKMSWNKALCSGHSIIRAQEYLVKMYDIPQCVMGHLVRHIHAQPYVLSKRPDRGGEDMATVCGDYADIIRQQADYLDGCEDWDKKSLIEMSEIIQQHLIEYSEHVRKLPDTISVENEDNPMDKQVGGDHYKMPIQPIEFIERNGLGFCVGNCIKYLCRYKKKNGKQDLEKAKHYIDLLIHLEYPE